MMRFYRAVLAAWLSPRSRALLDLLLLHLLNALRLRALPALARADAESALAFQRKELDPRLKPLKVVREPASPRLTPAPLLSRVRPRSLRFFFRGKRFVEPAQRNLRVWLHFSFGLLNAGIV
jgi:hypothetical protein